LLHIKLIAFGKCKEAYLREACGEYEKRLGAFARLEVVELPPAPLPDAPSPAQIAAALAAEEKAARAALPPQARVAALCIEGRALSSEQFSAWLEGAAMQGGSVALLLGSSFGMSETLKQQAELRLSLSAMTFPHQLARVLLLEQIYRAMQISAGGKYHK
jgi:23S rRNA (pseudouridine1915-N3)-methyltransferase